MYAISTKSVATFKCKNKMELKRRNSAANKKATATGLLWSSESESQLLELWLQNISNLRGVPKNSCILLYMEMANTLKASGFRGTGSDVRAKINKLTRKYREEKRKIGPSGEALSSWIHYKKVHEILAGIKDVDNLSSSESSAEDSMELGSDISCGSASDSEPTSKRQRRDYLAKFLQLTRESHARQLENLVKQNEVLQRMADNQAAFQRKLLEVFKKKD